MDLLSLLRTLGGLGTVLGILAAALWLVRRFDLKLPGRVVGARDRRLELVETLPIDGRRMVALLRRDGREHLILIAPEGHLVLETCVVRDDFDHAAADVRRDARETATLLRDQQREQSLALASESFGNLIDQAVARTTPFIDRARARIAPVIEAARTRALPVIDRALTRAAPVGLAIRTQLDRASFFRHRMPCIAALEIPPAPLPPALQPTFAAELRSHSRAQPKPRTRPKPDHIRPTTLETVDV